MRTGSEIAAHVEGVVHEETQRREHGFDLTAADVRRLATPGRIDFGGDELAAAETRPVETLKRDPGDDYGWWHLARGTYLLSHNEALALPDGESLQLQPRTALLERGVSHPTLSVTELPAVPLQVGGAGVRVKENARVSTLVRSDG